MTKTNQPEQPTSSSEKLEKYTTVAGSFRDPSGFLFYQNGTLYRQVNRSYKDDYDLLFDSGLYETLTKKGLLVSHGEEDLSFAVSEQAYKVIKPSMIPFISYPYEWCFSQLKDAALLTLELQKSAMEHGMSLKDATAYNIQFRDGRPIFIDTLSFTRHQEGTPWVAYRQFCQHFLAPLALMSYVDIRLNQFFRTFIDGVPLDLASRLLPRKTWFRFSLLSHIHLHAKSQQRHAGNPQDMQVVHAKKMSRLALIGILDNLTSTIKSLNWGGSQTEWGDYYEHTNYSEDATEQKHELVARFIKEAAPTEVWDLGANDGTYSRLALKEGANVVSWDIDPVAVEKNYLRMQKEKTKNLLALQLDLTNPSPAIGWANQERDSFLERGPTDLMMALALIHHLAISNNVPLARIAQFFASCASFAIVEFVPKEDSQVKRLLATREDIFDDYHIEGFESAFSPFFTILQTENVVGSERTLYLLKRK